MSEEVLYKACDLAFSRGKRAGLCFFGGEPLLRKDLIYKALDYCEAKASESKMRFDCKMTTNGTLLDEEFLERAVRSKMVIGLSFDGKAQDICRRFAGKDRTPSSGIVRSKAEMLLKYLPDSVAMATIAPQAVPYYSESVKYLHDIGFRRMSIVIAYGHKVTWTDDNLELLREELDKTCTYLKELFLKGDMFAVTPIDSKISECISGRNPAHKCHLGVRQMPVTPSGELYPCTSFIGDREYLLGNVFDGVDEEKVAQIASRSATPETCRECDLVTRCTNSCGCSNRMNTGDENKVSPLQCTYERMLISASDSLGEELYRADPEAFRRKYS